jgi:diguanylate cyclase (GGDEF)-like protein
MFGISIEELRGDVISDATKMQKYLPRMLAGEEIPIYEILFQKKDGQILPAEMSMELVRDANGNPMHIQALVRDISLRKQAEEQLKSANERLKDHVTEVEILQQELLEQSIRDPLTGLYNRRYLNETLEREIVRARRENDKFSVIISDIDHFKMINDTYGHQVGDQFIVAIANLQQKHTRSSDIVCRYGGEEFLLVLPGTSMDLAVKRAEEIRLKCAELNIQHEGKGLSATMSFGVATYPDNGDDADEIIIKADNAMYQSKQSGRNKVTAWAKDETSSAIKSE